MACSGRRLFFLLNSPAAVAAQVRGRVARWGCELTVRVAAELTAFAHFTRARGARESEPSVGRRRRRFIFADLI
jgi:hypothetical protein